MTDPFLLSRVLLRFGDDDDDLLEELSAAAITSDGSLWVGSDEFRTLERLSPMAPYVYGDHKVFHLRDYITLFNQEDEVDIEGMSFDEPYLWITGSHSTKRDKPEGDDVEDDIERLSEIQTDANRFLLMRIPVLQGELFQDCSHPDFPDQILKATSLEKAETGNCLMEALCDDPHLGVFVKHQIPSKDNGLDIEGLAVKRDRVFLGLRGPVLRGWAIVLELELELGESGMLNLKPIGKKQPYRKHFFDLNGLGIRELCFHNEDLLLLAGPTMDLEGAMQVFRWHEPLECEEDTLVDTDSKYLDLEFNLPFTLGNDHAEGLTLLPCLEQDGLLVVYDSPNPKRRTAPHSILMDVFRL
jgi:hypothetical protein